MELPRWIVVNGSRRTGTTLVYNALRLLLERLDRGTCLTLRNPLDMNAIVAGEPAKPPGLVKVHGWFPASDDPARVQLVFNLRDPLDTAASFLRFPEYEGMSHDRLRDWIMTYRDELHEAAGRSDTFLVCYEWAVRDIPGLVMALGVLALGEWIDHDARQAIAADLDPARIREWTTGPEFGPDGSELRRGHVSDTLGKPGCGSLLPPELQDRIMSIWKEEEWPQRRSA